MLPLIFTLFTNAAFMSGFSDSSGGKCRGEALLSAEGL